MKRTTRNNWKSRLTAEELRDLSMHGIETFDQTRNGLATGHKTGIEMIFDKLGICRYGQGSGTIGNTGGIIRKTDKAAF